MLANTPQVGFSGLFQKGRNAGKKLEKTFPAAYEGPTIDAPPPEIKKMLNKVDVPEKSLTTIQKIRKFLKETFPPVHERPTTDAPLPEIK